MFSLKCMHCGVNQGNALEHFLGWRIRYKEVFTGGYIFLSILRESIELQCQLTLTESCCSIMSGNASKHHISNKFQVIHIVVIHQHCQKFSTACRSGYIYVLVASSAYNKMRWGMPDDSYSCGVVIINAITHNIWSACVGSINPDEEIHWWFYIWVQYYLDPVSNMVEYSINLQHWTENHSRNIPLYFLQMDMCSPKLSLHPLLSCFEHQYPKSQYLCS